MEFEIKIKGNLYEDGDEFKIFSSSKEMHSALWDGLQAIRTRMKYEGIPNEEFEFLERLREDFYVPGMEFP